MKNIAVLVSGGGTNLQALIDAEKRGETGNGKITCVISSKEDAYALERAKNNGIKTIVLKRKDYPDVASYSKAMAETLKAENADLGETLMCKAENFTYTVSNDDYKIKLNGVSGSGTEIIANIEISRVDGTPVVDSFVNKYNPEDGIYGHNENLVEYKTNGRRKDLGGTGKYEINDDGNIEIVYVIGNTDIGSDPVANEKIILNGAKVYPTDTYFDFLYYDNNALAWFQNNELIYFKNCTDEIIEVDTSPVHYLDLYWSAEFTYVPSEKALKTIKRSYFGADDELMCKSYLYDDNDNKIELDCKVKFIDMKFTSTYATVAFDVEYETLENGDIPFPNIEKAYLVRKDGSKILMIMNSGHGANDEDYSFTYKYCSYYEENNLHAIIISKRKKFSLCVKQIDDFLPYIDNWSTCDSMRPKCFRKNTRIS